MHLIKKEIVRYKKMMSNIIQFIPRITKNCHKNQKYFIKKAKQCGAYGDVDWKKTPWDVTDSVAHQIRSHKNCRKKYRLHFTQHRKKGQRIGEPFKPPFLKIAMALVTLRFHYGGQHPNSQMVFVRGLRYIYDALAAKNYDINYLTQEDLNNAAAEARKREKKTSAYKLIDHIAEAAALIDKNRLSQTFLSWKCPKNRRPSEMSDDRLDDPEAIKAKHDKLPSDTAIRAVGRLYRKIPKSEFKNRLLILICTLSSLLGRRIGEILTLPALPVKIDSDGYKYLTYYAQKKSQGSIYVYPENLYLITATAELVEDVVNEILEMTQEARDTAKWIYDNQEPCLENLEMTGPDEASAANIKKVIKVSSAVTFLKTRKVNVYTKPGCANNYFFRVSELTAALKNELFLMPALPATEKGKTLFLHEILCIGFKHYAHARKQTFKYAVEPVNEQHVRDFLHGRGHSGSIFEKYGMADDNEGFIQMNSHEFRHYLNNLLDEGGAPELVQAEWFGRRFVGDNKSYQHQTPVRRALQFKKDIMDGKIEGSVNNVLKVLPQPARSAFLEARIKAVHDVGPGFCVHDFMQSPCDKLCSEQCNDFHWAKNIEERKNAVKRSYAITWELKETAKTKIDEEHWNADVWLQHAEKRLEILQMKLEELGVFEFDAEEYLTRAMEEKNAASSTNQVQSQNDGTRHQRDFSGTQ